jgi:MFS family permease
MLGYDIGVMAGAIILMQKELNLSTPEKEVRRPHPLVGSVVDVQARVSGGACTPSGRPAEAKVERLECGWAMLAPHQSRCCRGEAETRAYHRPNRGTEERDVGPQVALGCLNFVSGLGAILTSELNEYMGSPKSMAWCLGLYLLGMANVALSDGIKSLLFGRIVTGLGVGIGIAVCPQYIAEISPTGKSEPPPETLAQPRSLCG